MIRSTKEYADNRICSFSSSRRSFFIKSTSTATFFLATILTGSSTAECSSAITIPNASVSSQRQGGRGAIEATIPSHVNVRHDNNQTRGAKSLVGPEKTVKKQIEPIDIARVARENKINITVVENKNTKLYIDSKSFERLQYTERSTFPSWIPSFLLPSPKPQLVGRVSDAELLLASCVAGSLTEVLRLSILYPITTIKTRIQTAPPSKETRSFLDMLRTFAKSILVQTRIGDLYAGFLPSMLASVPASGVYYGVRDVTKRDIGQLIPSLYVGDDLSLTLISILVADIVSLAVRTPTVIWAVRRQAEKAVDVAAVSDEIMEVKEGQNGTIMNILDGGSDGIDKLLLEENLVVPSSTTLPKLKNPNQWWKDIWKEYLQQVPIIVVTDLPYLLLKTALIRFLAQGDESIVQYSVLNVFCAMVASALTTPFDVARTRILVDGDRNPTKGMDGGGVGGSGESVYQAMKKIIYENTHMDAGTKKNKPRIENLFAGWFERLAYFGIGIAWLEPIRILIYYAIRDVILLEAFD